MKNLIIHSRFTISPLKKSANCLAFWKGCSEKSEGPRLPSPDFMNIIGATIYLAHWFIVIPFIVFKMSLFRKTLIWEKTNHTGS